MSEYEAPPPKLEIVSSPIDLVMAEDEEPAAEDADQDEPGSGPATA